MPKLTVIPLTPNAKDAIQKAVRDTPRWRLAVMGVRFKTEGDFLVLRFKQHYKFAPKAMFEESAHKFMKDNDAAPEEYTLEVDIND